MGECGCYIHNFKSFALYLRNVDIIFNDSIVFPIHLLQQIIFNTKNYSPISSNIPIQNFLNLGHIVKV